ncbi:MAG: hypothetical protein ACN4GT_02945 [Gammaproteobacteria bacterium]
MIRFLGVMIGSAATLGGMLLLLGKPDFQNDELVGTDVTLQVADIEAVAATTVATDLPVELAESSTAATPPTAPVATTTADAERRPEPRTPPIPESTDTPELTNTEGLDAAPDASYAMNDSAVPTDADHHWHSFWNPFRSEIAANGFATRLTRVTGIDYRVLRLKPGSYQVAFAYADDNERRTKIAQIEQATGLELPEDSL